MLSKYFACACMHPTRPENCFTYLLLFVCSHLLCAHKLYHVTAKLVLSTQRKGGR